MTRRIGRNDLAALARCLCWPGLFRFLVGQRLAMFGKTNVVSLFENAFS